MSGYLLGIDAGNTVAKAVLFTLDGRTIASAGRDGATRQPAPGYVERDLNELWHNVQASIRDVITKAGIDAAAIKAIGCAGHGNGLYAIDDTGAPVVAIQSLDSRATALTAALSANGNDLALYDRCLQKPWPSQTATLLAWLKRYQPDIYARASTVFYCKDYVTFCLTGNRVSDYSDMSGGGLLHMPDNDYDKDLLGLYGLEDALPKLPELFMPTDIVGTVHAAAAAATGLTAGTPVVAGMFDVVASAVGSGAIKTGAASIIVGSWSINQLILDAPVKDPDNVFLHCVLDEGRYLANDSSATSAVNLEWFTHQFMLAEAEKAGAANVYTHCSNLVDSVDYVENLPWYHPFVFGGSTHANARGGFYGIEGWHGAAHMLHALFEGVVFGHRAHAEKIQKAGGRFETVLLSGGGTRSAVWSQMFADCLGIPVIVSECEETGALGASLGAAVGAGLFPDLHAAVGNLANVQKHFQPNPDKKSLYDRRYAVYESLGNAMAGPWAEMSALVKE